MKKTAIVLADGFEEVEALTVVDLLRRMEIGCDMVALDDGGIVTGSHGIPVQADLGFSALDPSAYDGLVLPGGMPGTNRLRESEKLTALLRDFAAAGKLTAAICAAPTVLGAAGLLTGKRAVCSPKMEDGLTGALVGNAPVAVDGTVITSRGVGTAIPFALAIVAYFSGQERADQLAASIVYNV